MAIYHHPFPFHHGPTKPHVHLKPTNRPSMRPIHAHGPVTLFAAKQTQSQSAITEITPKATLDSYQTTCYKCIYIFKSRMEYMSRGHISNPVSI